MDFDYTQHHGGVSYGFIRGKDKVVLIKSGLGGSCLGYKNKYLRMAHRLKSKHGCGVIVSSNPNDGEIHADTDRNILEQFIYESGIEPHEVYFFGNSNGCIKGLELASMGVKFKRMILVNMPLMINLHKIKRCISAIPDTHVITVYGEYDPSYKYTPFINGKFDNSELLSVPMADHNFEGHINEFTALCDMLIGTD